MLNPVNFKIPELARIWNFFAAALDQVYTYYLQSIHV